MTPTHTEIIARAVIRNHNRLLLVRQRGRSWYFLPGGHVEAGEPVEDALVRELGEELGTTAKISAFIGAFEHGYVEDGHPHHELNLVFETTLTGGEADSQEDHLEFRWMAVADLADTDIRPGAVKVALLSAGESAAPFWHAWSQPHHQ